MLTSPHSPQCMAAAVAHCRQCTTQPVCCMHLMPAVRPSLCVHTHAQHQMSVHPGSGTLPAVWHTTTDNVNIHTHHPASQCQHKGGEGRLQPPLGKGTGLSQPKPTQPPCLCASAVPRGLLCSTQHACCSHLMQAVPSLLHTIPVISQMCGSSGGMLPAVRHTPPLCCMHLAAGPSQSFLSYMHAHAQPPVSEHQAVAHCLLRDTHTQRAAARCEVTAHNQCACVAGGRAAVLQPRCPTQP